MGGEQRTRDAAHNSVLDEQVQHQSANDERVCHNCGQKGHIAKRCPKGGAGGGKGRGTRARASANAVAKSAMESTQQEQGARDAAKEAIRELKDQIAKMNAAPPIHALPDGKKLLFARSLVLPNFQSCPEPEPYRYRLPWEEFFVVLLSALAGSLVVSLPTQKYWVFMEVWSQVAQIAGGILLFGVALIYLVIIVIRHGWVWWRRFAKLPWKPYKGPQLVYMYRCPNVTTFDSDERGPTNRAQNMLYADPNYADWEVHDWTGVEFADDEEPPVRVRRFIVSEVLLQVLLSQTVVLHLDKPEIVLEKMVLLAKSSSCINIASVVQAGQGVVQNTVDLAFAALYGYHHHTDRRLYHHVMREPGNVRVPARL